MGLGRHIRKKKVGMGQTIATILRDHIVYRKQIIKLAGSDLRRTYRASALGWAWAVIKPLVTIFVYWFAFSVGLRKGGDIAGYPFVLWLISGIVPWFYMSEMLTLGTECILRNRYLVTKMKYPVSTIPTFTSISKFFVHLILLVLTMLIFILTGHMPTVYMLQLPFYMLCNFLFLRAGRCLPRRSRRSARTFRIWSSRSSRRCSGFRASCGRSTRCTTSLPTSF